MVGIKEVKSMGHVTMETRGRDIEEDMSEEDAGTGTDIFSLEYIYCFFQFMII
jgi:hypothetical protein